VYGIEPGETDLPTFAPFALFDVALGMRTVVPDMDFTRPAEVDAEKIVRAIQSFGVTNLFASPALLDRVSSYGASRGIVLPSLRRVISAGAPVRAEVVERFVSMLPPFAQVFSPYGATEALPVTSIGSRELLFETREQTDRGGGTCIGSPVPGVDVSVIRISDAPISKWDESLVLPNGEVGEIAVSGANVSQGYDGRPEATALARIERPDGGHLHRMGDLGYMDSKGRLWFCGRKSQRVVAAGTTLFTVPCERVFDLHPDVSRSALVAVRRGDATLPALCVELNERVSARERRRIRAELLAIAAANPHTETIQTVLFHPAFPVDARHNSKIFREKLAVWAARRSPY
jgi:acyl-CoA synthetase (AMP-forming)/AMP-acid ligase II